MSKESLEELRKKAEKSLQSKIVFEDLGATDAALEEITRELEGEEGEAVADDSTEAGSADEETAEDVPAEEKVIESINEGFWTSLIGKFLRYLLFIPVSIIIISLIYLLFGLLLYWFIGLSTFWLTVILIFFGSMIWGIFKMLSALIMSFTSKLSPSFGFALLTIVVLSVINGILAIVNAWSLDVNYSGKVVFGAIVYTVLVFELTLALIIGSLSSEE